VGDQSPVPTGFLVAQHPNAPYVSSKQYKILFFILGLSTIAFLIHQTGWQEIVSNISGMGFWFLPVIGSWIIIYLLNAWAFYEIIYEKEKPETRVSFVSVLQLTVTGYAINYITPVIGLGGEPYRVMELKPQLGVSKASASVLQYGLMHGLAHIAFWLFSLVLIVTLLELDSFLIVGCLVILLVGLVLGYAFLTMYRKGFLISVLTKVARWPLVGKNAANFLHIHRDTLTEMDLQLQTIYANRKADFYKALTLEFLARVVGAAEIYYAGLAIQLDISWIDALIVSSGSSLFANLMFFFPMQLGTREGGMFLALKSVGLLPTSGVFISLVTRIREFFWIVVGYAWMYWKERSHANKTSRDDTSSIF
jgi:hypothetical protein